MARTSVPASEVRAWARENLSLIPEAGHKSLSPTARGRLHPTVVEAFRKAHPRREYVSGTSNAPTVAVRVPRTDKNGRVSLRSQDVSVSFAREVLSLAGVEVGERGRLPEDSLTVVGAALLS